MYRRRSSGRKTRTTGSPLQYIIEPSVPSRNATSCPFGPSASRLPAARPAASVTGLQRYPVRMHSQTHRYTRAHMQIRISPGAQHHISALLSTRTCGECTLALIHRSPFFTAPILNSIPYNETPNGALQSEVLNYAILYIVLCK